MKLFEFMTVLHTKYFSFNCIPNLILTVVFLCAVVEESDLVNFFFFFSFDYFTPN